MCLAVPMKLIEMSEHQKGVTELEGTKYTVDLSLTPDAQTGDYLIVHAGYSIEQLDRDEAAERLKLFEEMAGMYKEDLR